MAIWIENAYSFGHFSNKLSVISVPTDFCCYWIWSTDSRGTKKKRAELYIEWIWMCHISSGALPCENRTNVLQETKKNRNYSLWWCMDTQMAYLWLSYGLTAQNEVEMRCRGVEEWMQHCLFIAVSFIFRCTCHLLCAHPRKMCMQRWANGGDADKMRKFRGKITCSARADRYFNEIKF